MRKNFFLNFFFLSIFLLLKPYPLFSYKLAVCAMFKNEAAWIKEWIEYHRIIGVEHFYLYDNESTDHFEHVLAPYVQKGIVELFSWNASEEHAMHGFPVHAPWDIYQVGAYNDCLQKRALGNADWVAMIDIDEFIVPVLGAEFLHILLDKMKKKHRGSLILNWKIFGTSHIWDLGADELLTEKLNLRAPDDFEHHKLFKSIHQPRAVEYCYIHYADLKKNYKKQDLDPAKFRIHHYWTRTEKYCIEKRGLSEYNSRDFLNQLNYMEDKTIFQYLPKLKERLFE